MVANKNWCSMLISNEIKKCFKALVAINVSGASIVPFKWRAVHFDFLRLMTTVSQKLHSHLQKSSTGNLAESWGAFQELLASNLNDFQRRTLLQTLIGHYHAFLLVAPHESPAAYHSRKLFYLSCLGDLSKYAGVDEELVLYYYKESLRIGLSTNMYDKCVYVFYQLAQLYALHRPGMLLRGHTYYHYALLVGAADSNSAMMENMESALFKTFSDTVMSGLDISFVKLFGLLWFSSSLSSKRAAYEDHVLLETYLNELRSTKQQLITKHDHFIAAVVMCHSLLEHNFKSVSVEAMKKWELTWCFTLVYGLLAELCGVLCLNISEEDRVKFEVILNFGFLFLIQLKHTSGKMISEILLDYIRESSRDASDFENYHDSLNRFRLGVRKLISFKNNNPDLFGSMRSNNSDEDFIEFINLFQHLHKSTLSSGSSETSLDACMTAFEDSMKDVPLKEPVVVVEQEPEMLSRSGSNLLEDNLSKDPMALYKEDKPLENEKKTQESSSSQSKKRHAPSRRRVFIPDTAYLLNHMKEIKNVLYKNPTAANQNAKRDYTYVVIPQSIIRDLDVLKDLPEEQTSMTTIGRVIIEGEHIPNQARKISNTIYSFLSGKGHAARFLKLQSVAEKQNAQLRLLPDEIRELIVLKPYEDETTTSSTSEPFKPLKKPGLGDDLTQWLECVNYYLFNGAQDFASPDNGSVIEVLVLSEDERVRKIVEALNKLRVSNSQKDNKKSKQHDELRSIVRTNLK